MKGLKFDRAYWKSRLKYPDWYIRLEKELGEHIFPIVHGDPVVKKFRHQVYELIEELLEKGEIPLAIEGPNFDAERKSIDTIVIHHTEEEVGIRLSKLSAIGFVRQYGLRYLQNDVLGRKLRGNPIWSDHFRNGKMVFFVYHWLVRPNGQAERLLKDEYIGWHSGVWEINTRSVGIAFSGNYEHEKPLAAQIKSAAMVIKKHYPQIDRKRIFGHLEIKKNRTCPGEYFLKEWKAKLLNLI
ncbi:N-acetylmuramoyl-L-alanine amidase [Candidatus Parcubacteria bacterium]|nr:N-acetylmuramoyl-L-alanine amidase [Patescibacteria group bacterium]MBU4466832.1 N-acetylmuramoyl-L-alanine amidase [Patescibacteria group bacterium]MCG2688785.1 N-acetylmuramoyl-L-alanine amidase [Candidatus Parcubacteria bacterium]